MELGVVFCFVVFEMVLPLLNKSKETIIYTRFSERPQH